MLNVDVCRSTSTPFELETLTSLFSIGIRIFNSLNLNLDVRFYNALHFFIHMLYRRGRFIS